MAQESPEEPSSIRINRFLSLAGVGSRRKADELIAEGRVSVNGEVLQSPGRRIDPAADRVTLDGERVRLKLDSRWILLNKPLQTLVTRSDMRGRKTVYDLLPRNYRHLIAVGRLDYDTEGVLLLTGDGDAANRLMHPRYGVRRVYRATVSGYLSDGAIERAASGVDLGDRLPAVAELRVQRRGPQRSVVRVTIGEGRKREVKRLMMALGHRVLRLVRISFAGMTVGTLQPGQWRQLSGKEIATVMAATEPGTAGATAKTGRSRKRRPTVTSKRKPSKAGRTPQGAPKSRTRVTHQGRGR